MTSRKWFSRTAVAAATRDYLAGCRYAVGWNMKRDIGLHFWAILSVAALSLSIVQPVTVLTGDQPLVNLLAAPVVLIIGLLSAAWVVHRYRRRVYPQADTLATVVHVTLDKVQEVRSRRRTTKRK